MKSVKGFLFILGLPLKWYEINVLQCNTYFILRPLGIKNDSDNHHKTGLFVVQGSISSISCSCINETNDHLLFVGGKDGRVKLFRTRWSKENIEMTDLGFLWEEKGKKPKNLLQYVHNNIFGSISDNISVCLIKLIPSRNNTRTTILIAKGYFLIKLVIELPITNDKKVIVVQHSCTIVGGSSITSICEASGGTFIVFCREGVPKLFEPSNTEIIMKPFSLESSQILDFKNQVRRCVKLLLGFLYSSVLINF